VVFYKEDREVEVKEENCMMEFYLGYCLDVKRHDGIKSFFDKEIAVTYDSVAIIANAFGGMELYDG